MDNTLKKRIESYRKGDDKRPLIIDFSDIEELLSFKHSYLSLPTKNIFDVSGKETELPLVANVYEFFDTCKEKECVVYLLGTLLKVYGKNELKKCIHSLISSSFQTKFIVVTFRCANYIEETVPKNKERIITVNSQNPTSTPTLIFIDPKYEKTLSISDSLKSAMFKLESSEGGKVFVVSKYSSKLFPYSMIPIEDCRTPYEVLCLKDFKVKNLSREYGTDAQWTWLLGNFKKDSIDYTISEFVKCDDILAEIKEWGEKNQFERWLIFLYLKLNDKNVGNWSVNSSCENSKNEKEFLTNIYNSILSLSYKDPDFWNKYKERKQILKSINDSSEVYSFCSYVQYKGEDAIYYLTDNTEYEKHTIIKTIDQYKDKYTKDQLMNILSHVYHDLYNYLYSFNYGNDLLNRYFDKYKYLKVINYLSPDFKEVVDKEARERNFKRLLMHRIEKLDELDLKDSTVYFIDALGAEFCSYIDRKSEEMGLQCRINLCQANLPTLTNKNTEFREYFAKKGISVKDEKRLDSLIHEGKDEYDFDKTKLPIHLTEELNILNDCLDEIKKKIKTQTIKKAVILSDHGSTRLAILNTEMVREDIESTGEHGGRVCKYIEGMTEIPNAIIEGDYCVLCDYNAIKGGRVGKVEMHGGGTIEEVTVPIIEIVEKDNIIHIKVIEKILKASYKKKAVLRFFASRKMENVSITINGKSYKVDTYDNMNFESELEDINKVGNYTFDVWEGDKLVSTGNEFIIEKEVGSSIDLWG